jgi:hypothetical protein
MRLFRLVRTIALLALLALGALLLWGHFRTHPEDLPWSPLDLSDPVGMFTGRKLAGLAEEGPRCAALLRQAGIRFEQLPPRRESAQCGYDEAVRFRAGGALAIGYRPASLGTACPVAAALALWEWHVVQPAAIEHFGTQVAAGWKGPGASMPAPMPSTSPASACAADVRSACYAIGRAILRKRPSCATCATAPAVCSRRCSRPTIMQHIATISISTRPRAAKWAGGRAAERVLVRSMLARRR